MTTRTRARRTGRPSLPANRIWARTRRDTATGCLLWLGAHDAKGYGRVRFRGRLVRVHRLAWQLARRRSVPAGRLIAHRCDRPPCLEPQHLRSSTHLQNMAEARERGRLAIGSRHGQAKLTEQVVALARLQVAMHHVTVRELAAAAGVASSTMADAIRGTTWSHV